MLLPLLRLPALAGLALLALLQPPLPAARAATPPAPELSPAPAISPAPPPSAAPGAPNAAPAHPALSFAPVPEWVHAPLDPAREVPHDEDQSDDLDYLVSERQVLTRDRAAFVQLAYRVLSPSGLASAAEFSVTFDPGYERIAFHHLRLIRDGVVQERLDLSDFEILREERDRDRALYDGRLTAVHHLRDVRVGDVIHYAYTRHGSNPVFGRHYIDALRLGWTKPLRQFRYRIVSPGPAAPPIHHRVLGDIEWPPEERALADGARELVWQRSPLPGRLADSGTPDWHVDFPFVQLSEFGSWREVVEWALPLYTASPQHPLLRAKINELRAASPDPAARLVAALTFVQEEVRYLGMELGANSHKPHPPEQTLERRFGDCKDKTLLLCTLLRALDIEADPALVHTSYGRSLGTPRSRLAPAAGLHTFLPTPLAFDHVIARVRLPDGRVFWLDPTRNHQTGPLEERTSFDFGQALLIRPGEAALTEMARPFYAAGRMREFITFTGHDFEQPVDMEIETEFEGDRATHMRARLAGITPAQLTRDYLNYYLQKFPGIASPGPVSWTDDRARNRIRVRERYTVPDFWTRTTEGKWRGELYPHAIADLVGTPGAQTRAAPLALSYPLDNYVEIRMKLHETWDITPLDLTVEDAFSRYVSTTRQDGESGVRLTYHYQTKEDHVLADEVGAHAATLAKIRDDLRLVLTKDPRVGAGGGASATEEAGETAFRLNPYALSLATFALCVLALSAFLIVRRPPPGPGVPPPLPAPPIGGWLILFALGVVLRAVLLPVSLVKGIENYFDLAIWETLTAHDSETRNVPLALLMQLELVCNLALVFLAWVAAILFFQRRQKAPRWNIVFLAFAATFLPLDMLLATWVGVEASPGDWKNPILALIAAFIWVPYLLLSRRVRRTFVR